MCFEHHPCEWRHKSSSSEQKLHLASSYSSPTSSVGYSWEGTAGCPVQSWQLGSNCGIPSCSATPLLGSTEHIAEPGVHPKKQAPAIPTCSHSLILKQNTTTIKCSPTVGDVLLKEAHKPESGCSSTGGESNPL